MQDQIKRTEMADMSTASFRVVRGLWTTSPSSAPRPSTSSPFSNASSFSFVTVDESCKQVRQEFHLRHRAPDQRTSCCVRNVSKLRLCHRMVREFGRCREQKSVRTLTVSFLIW